MLWERIAFWLLCHLAYLHYAMSTEEGKGKRAKTFGIAVVLICVLALAGYGVFAGTGITRVFMRNNLVYPETLTEEEKGYADAIERGREGYEELESVKMECFYRDADAEERCGLPEWRYSALLLLDYAGYAVYDGAGARYRRGIPGVFQGLRDGMAYCRRKELDF